MADPYNTAPVRRDPWGSERVKKDRRANPLVSDPNLRGYYDGKSGKSSRPPKSYSAAQREAYQRGYNVGAHERRNDIYNRARNPGASRHSQKWDDCVQAVKKQGTSVDPYAVCTASLHEIARRGKRARNPLDIMTALNAAGDLIAVDQVVKSADHKKRRKNPYGEGVCPPHLKRYRFKKVR